MSHFMYIKAVEVLAGEGEDLLPIDASIEEEVNVREKDII